MVSCISSFPRWLRPLLTLTVVCSCGFALKATGLADAEPAPPGLISWWRGEGNASDSVGQADGRPFSGVKFVAGKVGQCFAFDGVGSGINVPDVPTLALTNSLTIECWLLVPQVPTAPGMVIFRGDIRPGLDPYYVSVEPRAGTPGMLGSVVWGADNVNDRVDAPVPLGAWTHVAAVLEVNNCARGNRPHDSLHQRGGGG